MFQGSSILDQAQAHQQFSTPNRTLPGINTNTNSNAINSAPSTPLKSLPGLSASTTPAPSKAFFSPGGLGEAGLGQAYTDGIEPCPLEFLRPTTQCFPQSPELEQMTGIPLGCIVAPFAPSANPIPLCDYGNVVRCSAQSCRAYINPYISFPQGPNLWKCNFCHKLNEVPPHFAGPVENGRRLDRHERLELNHALVEFVATNQYHFRPPQPPIFLFVIDVSILSAKTGVLTIISDAIMNALDYLIQSNELTKIAFITFDSAVHYYSFTEPGLKPMMMVDHELAENMPPPGHEMLITLSSFLESVQSFLTVLPQMFQSTLKSTACLGSAVKAAYEVGKLLGGKMLLFSSAIPTVGLGKLDEKYDLKLIGTPKEISLIVPACDHYKTIAGQCTDAQISIDLFLASAPGQGQTSHAGHDAAHHSAGSLSCLAQLTGGQIFSYPYFNALTDGAAFGSDIIYALSRDLAWEAVMRVRATHGVKIHHIIGNFSLRQQDMIVFPVLDAEKAVGVHFKVGESIDIATQGEDIYIQAGLLYTNTAGERKIRVMTRKIPLSSKLEPVQRAADTQGIVSLLAKLCVHHAFNNNLPATRDMCVNQLSNIALHSYNKNSRSLILPEQVQSLPLYILALLKSAGLRNSIPVPIQDRVLALDLFRTLTSDQLLLYLCPRLFSLHDMPDECGIMDEQGYVTLPFTRNLTLAQSHEGVFLLDNGQFLLLWVGKYADSSLVSSLSFPFSGAPHMEYDESRDAHEFYNRVSTIVTYLRSSHSSFQRYYFSHEGDSYHVRLMVPYMIEDHHQGSYSSREFVDFVVAGLSKRT